MGGRAAEARARAPEKTSAPARDDRGRFKAGCSGNPRGALPLTPERKAVRDLAAAERVPNIATLVSIRDSSKDEWARIEACKLLLMYSDGKPVTASGPLVAMQFNQGAPAPTFGTNVDPVDATVLLATEGHLMSEEQRDQIVASVYGRANSAAQRVAERRPRLAIEAPSAAITEPAPAEKPLTADPSPPPADSAAPGASEVALDTPVPERALEALTDLEALRRIGGAPPPEPTDDDGETFMTLEEALQQMRSRPG